MHRILIVEDDPIIGRQLEMLLSHRGYATRHAEEGHAALQVAESWVPDVVLLDIMLPGLSGFDVLERMRENDALVLTPVILISGLADIREKTRGFESGADDYIVKPFSNDDLCLRVEAHLRRRNQIAAHQSSQRVAMPSRPPLLVKRQRSGVFRRGYQVTKRLFDLTVCLATLPFTLPLMLVIAFLVKLDSEGPVIFRQQRTGMDGRRFTMYKFRTMLQNADEIKEAYAHLNQLTWPDFKIPDDPRVTPLGKILRKTSLDELPQIFNVIKGDMSLVGPRPTSFAADTYELWQTERLEVRPGLTGLWQINGRADTDFHERSELDIEYIERQSWALDINILFSTAAAVLTGRGSY